MCPLCQTSHVNLFWIQTEGINWALYSQGKGPLSKSGLFFFRCSHCSIIFKDPSLWLAPALEKERYQTHENAASDIAYQNFLEVLMTPVLERVPPGAAGLDFGCGPTDVMAQLFRARGYGCLSYDPHFFPERRPLGKSYDFVTCCEAAEHFYSPAKEFAILFSLLKPGGWLAVRTRLIPDDFKTWWYHKDPTHVIFYARSSFEWIAKNYSSAAVFLEKDVILMRKPILKKGKP